jgi:ribosome-associated translation inhibitor RaiA
MCRCPWFLLLAAVYDSLDKAVASLEKKLHKYSKPLPQKKDYRKA